MQAALRIETTVLPGQRIEIADPALPEGVKVEVIVVLPEKPVGPRFASALEFLESLPTSPSPRAFPTWEEYEKHLQEERNSWDR